MAHSFKLKLWMWSKLKITFIDWDLYTPWRDSEGSFYVKLTHIPFLRSTPFLYIVEETNDPHVKELHVNIGGIQVFYRLYRGTVAEAQQYLSDWHERLIKGCLE